MGNPKQKWTSEEEEALRAGVAKHGAGKWKNIQRDPEFNHLLFSRSNIDLKDKWRNLNVANGEGSRDKSKIPKAKANPNDAPPTPLPISQDVSTNIVMLDSSRPLPEGNNNAKYNEMIYKALSTFTEPNGLDSSAIATFIEQREEVPQNFRRWLSSRLRRLVQQNKLEKVENCYRVKRDAHALVDTKSPTPLQIKDSQPRQVESKVYLGGRDIVEEAAVAAAYRFAEAENKSFVASEAVKESERVLMMAEENEILMQLATYCFEQSAHGEIPIMA